MPEFQNQQALTDIFGYWPSFHDAEVISLLLDREGSDGPYLEVKVHLWEMTDVVDERGYYVLTKHTLAALRFSDVLLESVRGFNHQNVLFEIEITEIDPATQENAGRMYEVSMPTSHGCEAFFKCRSVQVVSAEAYQAPA